MQESSSPDPEKIRLGISSCLLGHKVRHDASHKYDAFINQQLARFFEFLPVCPEVGIGLGTPRPTIRLMENARGEVRAVGVKDASRDVTEPLRAYFTRVSPQLQGICGYILKKGSPSCGMERVKIYTEQGMPLRAGSGLYAESLMQNAPLLPVEEEGRLHDAHLRENFITRVFVYHRWQCLNEQGLTPGKLVEFHSRHKLLVMAHSQAAYKRLGRLVAEAGKQSLQELGPSYFEELMTALKRKAGNQGHVNVLQHLMGYLKKHLDGEDKAELLETLESYRRGQLPLVVPLTLLKHHFRKHPHPYVADQVYLSPHPAELMLRNSI